MRSKAERKAEFEKMAREAGKLLTTSFLAGSPFLICPFCKRPIYHLMKHHLIPKSLKGKETVDCCRDCHNGLHALIPNKELKRYYHTVKRLLEHEGFRTMVAWIAKQDPTRKVAIKRANDQRGRGKYR